MPRKPRIVIPNQPHHITQRGNRRQDVFFSEADRIFYLQCLTKFARQYEVSTLAYCLMKNHVHLVLVPGQVDSLHRLLKCVHTKYAHRINKRNGWTGHLWQARFFSSILDEKYLLTAVRYVELNPVRAGITQLPHEHPWSSARARVKGELDPVLNRENKWNDILPSESKWSTYLSVYSPEDEEKLRKLHQRNFPCGSDSFVANLEDQFDQKLTVRKVGRPKKVK